MIVRTDAGARLVAAAIQSGRLVEETPLTTADLGRMQPHHVRRKLSGLARARGLAAAGSLAPRFFNMRAEELDAALGEDDRRTEEDGATRRAIQRRR